MSGGWASAREILCVRLDTIGDVLMTTPALRAVSAGGRRLTLLTSPSGAAVGRLVPDVDEIIEYAAPWMKAERPPGTASGRALLEQIFARRFDAAVIFTVYTQNPLPAATLCHLAEIPLRLAHARDKPYGLLTDWVPDPEPERMLRHEVERQLDLVASVGWTTEDRSLSLTVPPDADAAASSLLEALGLRERFVAIHPGGTAPSRRYPTEWFGEAARQLTLDHGVQVLWLGGAEDVAVIEQLRRASGFVAQTLAGRLDITELAAVLRRASVLVANNSGPAHIAAAVGTPVVDLYALTNPQHTPWGVPSRVLFHDVPCRFCYSSVCRMGHHDCLRKVAPADIVAATLELLADRPASGRAETPLELGRRTLTEVPDGSRPPGGWLGRLDSNQD